MHLLDFVELNLVSQALADIQNSLISFTWRNPYCWLSKKAF